MFDQCFNIDLTVKSEILYFQLYLFFIKNKKSDVYIKNATRDLLNPFRAQKGIYDALFTHYIYDPFLLFAILR